MKPAYIYPIMLVGVAIIISLVYFCIYDQTTTVILVRHAEKEFDPGNPDDPNPDLADAVGTDRADALVKVAKDAGVTAIYTTEFCRTAQTAQPLARQLGVPLFVQDNGLSGDQLSGCDPAIDVPIERLPIAIDTIAELIDKILAENSGRVVLVVGHSNTVPQMIEELGVAPLCPDYFPFSRDGSCNIPDAQFDNLFIVTVTRIVRDAKLIKARYGN